MLLTSDEWATVSQSYKDEILASSALRELLAAHPKSFAQSNGIDKEQIRAGIIREFGKIDIESHFMAKSFLQKNFFGLSDLDESKIIISTVGRMVEQKQIKLILSIVPYCVESTKSKVQFLIAGSINPEDKYGVECAKLCRELKEKYPNNFWANPDFFFHKDRLHLLHGSDFGILCSKFEPGGLVQLEYLSANTPVLATYTGGLKDTLTAFEGSASTATGYFIEQCSELGVVYSINRAIALFEKKDTYYSLREYCYSHVVTSKTMTTRYLEEFYSLCSKYPNLKI